MTILFLAAIAAAAIFNHIYDYKSSRVDERSLASVNDPEVLAAREKWEKQLIERLSSQTKEVSQLQSGGAPTEIERFLFGELKGQFSTRRIQRPNESRVSPVTHEYEVLNSTQTVVGRLTVEHNVDGRPSKYRFSPAQ